MVSVYYRLMVAVNTLGCFQWQRIAPGCSPGAIGGYSPQVAGRYPAASPASAVSLAMTHGWTAGAVLALMGAMIARAICALSM